MKLKVLLTLPDQVRWNPSIIQPQDAWKGFKQPQLFYFSSFNPISQWGLTWLHAIFIRGDLNWKKSPKFQLLAEIFLTPPPPSSKKGPTDENVGISYLVVIIKFGFLDISNPPPPISSESWTSPIFTIEVAP